MIEFTLKETNRFNSKVVKSSAKPDTSDPRYHGLTPCHEWLGSQCKGYGTINIRGKILRSHRVAWTMTHGPIPDGLWILHKCDNRRCVNPDHLFIGTNDDNMKDMYSKGRGNKSRGTSSYLAKLDERAVMTIRSDYAGGHFSQQQLANRHGVSQAVISAAILRKTWKHVPETILL